MRKILLLFFTALALVSCKSQNSSDPQAEVSWKDYDESAELESQADNDNPRLRFKLLSSKISDKNAIWEAFDDELEDFSEEKYQTLKPVILEGTIPTLQKAVKEGVLSYTDLTLFYLYRIRKYESDKELYLNAIISLNPEVVEQARELDRKRDSDQDEFSLYGMPILIKDNVNTEGMPTTAGAAVLSENYTNNAFIVDRLLDAGALILGKLNLSEWAYYFCDGCPLGYSAIGGQTLNPYGRKVFESGGSSSGSGVAVAVNYAVAAIGTETSGSILSPASKNSVVGLKPSVGLLSRTGIIPISSTMDTPGPMGKSVVDTAILLQAMTGKDPEDEVSVASEKDFIGSLKDASIQNKRIGVMKSLLTDSLYAGAVEELENLGAILVPYDAPEVSLEGFTTLLNIDMKHDLPAYLSLRAGKDVQVKDIEDIIAANLQDTAVNAPYGQALFEGIVRDTTTLEELEILKENIQQNGRRFFDEPMEAHSLDVVLSIDNYHAGYAAVAQYPALAVPMGFQESGEPRSLTFIGRPFEEDRLLQFGFHYETATNARKLPASYK